MNRTMTFPEVDKRLHLLEDEAPASSTTFPPRTLSPSLAFEFVVQVDGREVWSGLDIEERVVEILQERPEAQIAIDWRSSSMILA